MSTLRSLTTLVMGVRARHRCRPRQVPPLDTVFLARSSMSVTSRHLHARHSRVLVAPRFELHVAPAATTGPQPTAQTAATPPAATVLRLARATHTERTIQSTKLVERTHARGVRVEPGAPTPPSPIPAPSARAPFGAAASPATTAPSIPSVPPLVLRAPPVPPALTAAMPAPDGPARRSEPEPVEPPGSRASVDVERITDSVIDAIDRRLIANRERFGIR